ncbi:hypothetical protein BKA58DRAFT_458941 [Alternaria rosae]|uniref:uncharacterized protein n=1 Tax=Alternaria rosae TaxID=1187941 RepID=UPI001E8CB31A|nr:uncharacterized protein BKA58DRAFT_458941 [Alternaria rosae]KAH6868254.1 hypothetical protein BKA58DRAFT_458941 [Alternaria rosae]
MNANKNLPSRQPATAKETNQVTLQDLGFINPLRTVSNKAKDDGELISSTTPTDANIGYAKGLGESIAEAMSTAMQHPMVTANYRLKEEVRRSASSELLKIEDLRIYQSACAAYRLGLERGWSKERLLESVEEWKVFGVNSKRK